MNLRTLGAALALLAIGFAAGAWWMDARRAPEIAALEQAAAQSMVTDLAKLGGLVPGPQLPPDATKVAHALAVAQPAPVSGGPAAEPPASWMSIDQQRAVSLAYREALAKQVRAASDRMLTLNAELFLVEGHDPNWSAGMESRIRDSFAESQVFQDATLVAVECRVTVCRAAVEYRGFDPRETMRFGGQSPWSAWRGQWQPEPPAADGSVGYRATVYLGEDFDRSSRREVGGNTPKGPGGP